MDISKSNIVVIVLEKCCNCLRSKICFAAEYNTNKIAHIRSKWIAGLNSPVDTGVDYYLHY